MERPGTVVTLVVAILLVTHSIFRGRRWERESDSPPLVWPPLVVCCVIVLASWLVFAALRRGADGGSERPFSGELDQRTRAGQALAAYESQWNTFEIHRTGTLTAPAMTPRVRRAILTSLTFRTMNLGLVLVAACAAFWAVVVWRFARLLPNPRSSDSAARARRSLHRRWLTATAASCLWLGLGFLAVHAWCTLALGACLRQVFSHV